MDFREHLAQRLDIVLYLAFLLVWFPFMAVCLLQEPLLDHGTFYTDNDVLIAGQNYAEFGFSATRGMVIWDRPRQVEEGTPYTHYPPLPQIINGVFQSLGITSLAALRLVALCVTFLAALVLPMAFYHLIEHRSLALMASAVYVFNWPFMHFADGLHQFSYGQLTLFLYLVTWSKTLSADDGRPFYKWGAISAFLYLVNGWVTFEYIMYIGLVSLAMFAFRPSRRNFFALVAMAGVSVSILATRFLHNAYFFGSFALAYQDLTHAAQARSTTDVQSSGSVLQQSLYFTLQRLGWPEPSGRIGTNSLPLFLPYVAVPLALGLALVLAVKRKTRFARLVGKWWLILVGVGMVWMVVMKGHAAGKGHDHLVFLLLPAWGLGGGYVLWELGRMAGEGQTLKWKKKEWPLRGPALVILIATTAGLGYYMAQSRGINKLVPWSETTLYELNYLDKMLVQIQNTEEHLRENSFLYVDDRLRYIVYYLDRRFEYVKGNRPFLERDFPTSSILVTYGITEPLYTAHKADRYGFPHTVGQGEITLFEVGPPRGTTGRGGWGSIEVERYVWEDSWDRPGKSLKIHLVGTKDPDLVRGLGLSVALQDDRGNNLSRQNLIVGKGNFVHPRGEAWVEVKFPRKVADQAAGVEIRAFDRSGQTLLKPRGPMAGAKEALVLPLSKTGNK